MKGGLFLSGVHLGPSLAQFRLSIQSCGFAVRPNFGKLLGHYLSHQESFG